MAVALISNIMLIRHSKRRKESEDALSVEISFRRAMENSMATGMRVIDLEGQITYVNPAFCDLVGLSERELLATYPPYPYWPPEEIEKLTSFSRDLLDGKLDELGDRHSNA